MMSIFNNHMEYYIYILYDYFRFQSPNGSVDSNSWQVTCIGRTGDPVASFRNHGKAMAGM